MKTQVAAAVAALMAIALINAPAQAQNPAGANAQKFGVAVIDINYIFKNNASFDASMKELQAEFQRVDAEVKGKQQQIVKAQEQKKSYQPGSAEYKGLDEQLIKMQAALQVEVAQKQKSLVERKAKIYYDTYVQVDRVIKYYADRQGIGLVFRFNGEGADPNNPESIMRSINKPVQYQNSVDITPDVLALLNRQNSSAQQTTPTRR